MRETICLFKIHKVKADDRRAVSVSSGLAAVNIVDDLRGLGIVTNKHFYKMEPSAEYVKIGLLVQEGIACQYRIPLFYAA